MWNRGRARFLRRLALVVAVLLFLSAAGAISLLSMLFSGHAGGAGHSSPVVPVLIGVVVFALLSTIVSRVGGPLGDIVEAANRVADGDYSTRINAHGPRSLRVVGDAFNTMMGRLQAQDLQRRELMADIAHELRTPLTVIQGRLEGLLDGIYSRDDACLDEVLEQTRMLSRLVEDLRTLANAESGILSLEREPTAVSMLIRDVVNSLSSDAASRRVAIRIDVAPQLPLIDLDPLRIREVISNLLSNALHHTPAGGVVSVAAIASGERLTVTVTDTGQGIPAEDLPRIFDRFYKGATSRGSGLGLTIARKLVTAHGGDIRAESQPGTGTTMTIALPITHTAAPSSDPV